MNRCLQSVVVVVVVVGGQGLLSDSPLPSHDIFAARSNDLLSSLAWATLDFDHLRPDSGGSTLTSLEGLDLNLTSFSGFSPYFSSQDVDDLILPEDRKRLGLDREDNMLSNDDSGHSRNASSEKDADTLALPHRRKRTLGLLYKGPAYLDLEIRFTSPLFNVYESTNLNAELFFNFNMELPELTDPKGRTSDHPGGLERWDEAVSTMLTDIEGLISMLGVDGSSCMRRTLCELASTSPIAPEGLVGEMVQIMMRQFLQDVKESEVDIGEDTKEDEMPLPEKENQKKKLVEKSGKDKQTGKSGLEKDGNKLEKDTGKSQRTKGGEERLQRSRRDYQAASEHGRRHGDCEAAFPECPLSLLHLFNSS